MLTLLVMLTSCGEDFLDVQNLNDLDITTVYKTEEDLTLALNHLYFSLPRLDLEDDLNSQNSDQAYLVPYFWTDDAVHRSISGAGTNGSDFLWGDNTRSLRTFYRYQDIADINFFLEALPDATFTTEENRVRFAAEARFLRAWIYESMVFAYGDVPLLTNTIGPAEQPFRTPRQEVFNFVISELDEIDDILPERYDETSDAGRITKGAVLALKSRAYLNAIGWNSNVSEMYAGAEAACEEIINSNVYSLASGIDGFAEQFTSASDLTSSETILSTIYLIDVHVSRIARQIGLKGAFRGTDGGDTPQRRPGYSSDFIEEVQTINGLFPKDDTSYDPANPWENRDPRLAVSVVLPGDTLPAAAGLDVDYIYQPHVEIAPSTDNFGGVNCPTGYAFRKYLDYSLATLVEGDTDLKVIRYSEILLMYAEALAGQGEDGSALGYLNQVRNRVGMPSYTLATLPIIIRGTTGDGMIDAILLERRYEFAGEGPQRWFDIWRYKLGDQVITSVYALPINEDEPGDLGDKYPAGGENSTTFTRTWDDRNYLLPIWSTYLDANTNLTQNPGW
ncbi:RagB/SusD family nutrient uptake outer membrane protein [Flavicella sp.]|uniref:RagB/SusD family nutrient uptake outer membrane protein n=1 Tax=Flavicella sp. TaxID=2957742 RepID=UPI003015B62D